MRKSLPVVYCTVWFILDRLTKFFPLNLWLVMCICCGCSERGGTVLSFNSLLFVNIQ
ncbi:hypothetical protein AKO1_002607 [Acrasis kona]|uniref:Uncharacterized protein n=1 Tax=Acrasis kona TaxID=1008807 RepID=A0AAW2Z014_9EUKA